MMAVLSVLPCTPSSSTARPEAPCFDTPEFSGILFAGYAKETGFTFTSINTRAGTYQWNTIETISAISF